MKKPPSILCILLFCSVGLYSQGLNMSLVGEYTYPGQDGSDIWGYYDSTHSREYAIMGVHDGLSVVDITDPANPVEEFYIPGTGSIWRDIKTWDHYAYIIHDTPSNPQDPGEGLLIVDLWDTTGNTYYYDQSFTTAHNIWIDENGFAYIFGANMIAEGAIILDLSNPISPTLAGSFDQFYFHDGMVRGDTLWGGAVYDGFFAAVDVSDKANPQLMATRNTPDNFTHNVWISQNGKTLFTTDELSDGNLTAYDVSDFSNITEIDRFQPTPGSGSIPHNTHAKGDLLFTSWYRDGVRVVDASDPSSMIEVGYFDTYSGTGNGFDGNWGCYPYSPTGLILTSEINSGPGGAGQLLIYDFLLVSPCQFSGVILDNTTNMPLVGVAIEVMETGETYSTDNNGEFSLGFATPAEYNLIFTLPTHMTDTLTIDCQSGGSSTIDAGLDPLPTMNIDGTVQSGEAVFPVEGAQIQISSGDLVFETTTVSDGTFSFAGVTESNYTLNISAWGFIGQCDIVVGDGQSMFIALEPGYQDNFSQDLGWEVSGQAPTGIWERGEPIGTYSFQGGEINPEFDVDTDCGDWAFVTGNGGGNAGQDDVDSFSTILRSPSIDLSSYGDPRLQVHLWFVNRGNQNPIDDSLNVYLDNDTTSVMIYSYNTSNTTSANWNFHEFKVSDYFNPSDNMHLSIVASDWDFNSQTIVEAGIDLFAVVDSFMVDREMVISDHSLSIFPNPVKDKFVINSSESIISMELIDLQGQVVLRQSDFNNRNHEVNVESIPAGLYLVNIKTATTSYSEKLVKR